MAPALLSQGLLYVAKHFSYYVAPGAKKIKTSGNYSNNVAFKNPDGSVVVVLNNTSTSAISVGMRVGGQMVNSQLPGKSFATVVFSNATGTGSPDRKSLPAKGFYHCMIQRTNGSLTFLAQGNSFSAQLIGLDGNVVKTMYAESGKAITIRTKGLPAGMYILNRIIDGRVFGETVIVN